MLKKIIFALALSVTSLLTIHAQNPSRSASEEVFQELNHLLTEVCGDGDSYTSPKIAYKALNDSTVAVVYDMITTTALGERRVVGVEFFYSILKNKELASFNMLIGNTTPILTLAQRLYESKINSKSEDQSEDEFKDEVYWFTILSHLSEKGYTIK